jgi:hypothetical protein
MFLNTISINLMGRVAVINADGFCDGGGELKKENYSIKI